MPKKTQRAPHLPSDPTAPVSREGLIAALNDDLAREYQAIIAYVV